MISGGTKHDVLTKLSHLNEWIASLVAQYRPSANRASELKFARLKKFFSLQTLEGAHCVVVDAIPSPPLTRLGLNRFETFEHMAVQGITYHDLYFVRRDCAEDEALHFHELIHAIQWRHLGAARFIEMYALNHLNCGGYNRNPFEVIAYQLQAEFERDEHIFQVEPLVLDHVQRLNTQI